MPFKSSATFLFIFLIIQPIGAFNMPIKTKEHYFTEFELRDKLIDGSLGPTMIKLVKGSFLMGDSSGSGQSYERPIHLITLDYSFAISKYPITFAEYDKFSHETNRKMADQYKWPRGQHPVINVNWSDAKAYARWLSRQTHHLYRLPSEAEWEYATRAGSDKQFPWGDQMEPNRAHCKNCDDSWEANMTVPIGRYAANNWGIHGMIGNVWEMTADCWNYDYINAPSDGTPWQTGDCLRLVLRGGSWGDGPKDLRSSTRLRSYAAARTVNIGFRLVREEAHPRNSAEGIKIQH